MSVSRTVAGLDFELRPLGLGTWLMSGFHWGADEDAALEQVLEEGLAGGFNFIDTAPIYGFGRSEETVGRVMKRLGKRDQVILATKFGLEWDESKISIRRNSSKKSLMRELDKSRRRLQTDVIDLYQVHWPDPHTEIGETMDALLSFYDAGIIRAIGLSNFTVPQMEQAMRYAPIHSCQIPFNLFEQRAAEEIIPFCRKSGIAVLAYSPLCRGLLSGKFSEESCFDPKDIRFDDPKFQGAGLRLYLKAVSALKTFAEFKKCSTQQLALSWVFNTPGICTALVGARSRAQAASNAQAIGVSLTSTEWHDTAELVKQYVPQCGFGEPLKPSF